MTRVCACGCGASLDGQRSDALYASAACRARASKLRNTNGAQKRTETQPARFWGGIRAVRRRERAA